MTAAVAFIGLGAMGGPMAANLVAAGHTVTGFDPNPAATAESVPLAPSAAEAVRDADVVITVLSSGNDVLDCYAGLVTVARADALFVDCSTIGVADARVAHDLAADAGRRAVDAPASGGVVGATAGTLTFTVGGAEEDCARAEPVLKAMGRQVVRRGPSGAGQAAKICEDVILGLSVIAAGEAFVLGEEFGLDDRALAEIAATAFGRSRSLTTGCPVPDHGSGVASGLVAEDLGLAADALRANGLDLRAAGLYARLAAEPVGALDFSAIVSAIRSRSA
ncbi:MAG TPA: NAD(P)-binding domain-containing protein [Umezawaea sp.]|nr:NAD(P)-binding domain-containing protein [Umezawaea sp.]